MSNNVRLSFDPVNPAPWCYASAMDWLDDLTDEDLAFIVEQCQRYHLDELQELRLDAA
jgi:hypothetical protein